MFKKLLYKFQVFMIGRNGPDNLFNLCMFSAIAVSVVSIFIPNYFVKLPLNILYWVLFGYGLFRLFSKNVYKRRTENAKYVKFKNKFIGFFTRKKAQFRDRKTHVYKKCPSCKATLRLPKSKGEHGVRCPKCGNNFKVKI